MSHLSIENLQNDILQYGEVSLNKRTGVRVRTSYGETLDYRKNFVVIPESRFVSPRVAAAELAWTLSEDLDIGWLQQYTPMWNEFTVGDTNEVAISYGQRWQSGFGRNQLEGCIEHLRNDRSTRQAIVMAWDPAVDGCGGIPQPNIPCPMGFAINVTDSGCVDLNVFQRSMDCFVGAPYDLMMYGMLAEIIRNELRLPESRTRFQIANAHLYECHWEMVCPFATMPADNFKLPFTLSFVKNNPEEFVKHVHDITKPLTKDRIRLKPEVVK